MIAALSILDTNVAGQPTVMLSHRLVRDHERLVNGPQASRPLCGSLAEHCIASGCPITALLLAVREARQAEAS